MTAVIVERRQRQCQVRSHKRVSPALISMFAGQRSLLQQQQIYLNNYHRGSVNFFHPPPQIKPSSLTTRGPIFENTSSPYSAFPLHTFIPTRTGFIRFP